MRLQPRLIRRDGIENTRNTMGDIILDDIAYKEGCQIDTHDWINQIQPVGTRPVEGTGEQQHNLVDDPMQREGCNSCEETHDKGQRQEKHPVAHVLYTPFMKTLQHRRF